MLQALSQLGKSCILCLYVVRDNVCGQAVRLQRHKPASCSAWRCGVVVHLAWQRNVTILSQFGRAAPALALCICQHSLKRYKVFVRDPTIIAIVLRIQTTVAQQLFIFFCYRFIRDNKNIEKTKTFKVYWAWKDLNLRLYAYQAYTLNHWVTRP